ncbi:thioesterase-like superfamily-domain-containing protein [Hypoxylon rubiginosum]|uniref:Thioesterase-like superfamily-domain-containing protein n=1 Tax=Hypoxylon rubiginosum TaxID=110542 RepID=A0ACB9ZAS0_9PEZI|nr:thioesterase-like superfamily-domain-containing protein [Hypoxylon rubiginosum]
MAQIAPIETLIAVTKVTEAGPDTYINKGNLTFQEGLRSAFGGSQLGQSAAAAAATVPPTFQIYSIQSAFLRAVKPKENVRYHIERVLDGRCFASRIVRATQGSNNACLYTATICFQRNDLPVGNFLDYHVPMPAEGNTLPDNIRGGKVQEMLAATTARSAPLLQLGAEEEPFDWRPFDHPPVGEPTKFWQRSFVRSPAIASTSPHVHQSALAFLSDSYTIGAALHANPKKVGKQLRNVAMAVTLATSLSIHEPMVKVDEWMFTQHETSWGSDGRVVIRQWYWDVKSGRLIMSGTQECLVRLKDASKL